MREIRFRTFNQSNGKMYYALYGCFLHTNLSISPSTNHVLMQYTGLKDSNGVYIYEGDIISVDVETEKEDLTMQDDYILGEVVYDHAGFKARIKADDGYYVTEIDHDTLVMGNIYEHKHLLDE